MWTHEILDVSIVTGRVKAQVKFTQDDVFTIKPFFPSSLDELKRNIKDEQDQLDATEVLKTKIPLGVLDLTLENTGSVAQAEYSAKKFLLFEAEKELKLGLITQQEFDAQKLETINAKP